MRYLNITLVFSLVFSLEGLPQNDSSYTTIFYMSSAPIFNHSSAEEFLLWCYKTIEYPKSALIDSVSGKVYAKFLIDSTGSVRNATILKGVRNDLDSAVTKVLLTSPKWIPAKQGDRNIGVPFMIQIVFDIKDPFFKNQILDLSKHSKRRIKH